MPGTYSQLQDRFPIISEPILKRYRERDTSLKKIAIPSPFGYSLAPLTGTLGDSRASMIQMLDLRFNAFGSNEAAAIFFIYYDVRRNTQKNKILDDLNQTFPNSVDLNVASQEIDALKENSACSEWTNDHLPIDASLFVE
jgi:hypothetical protein